MKKLLSALAVLITLGASAQGLRTPAASPSQTIKQDFALSSIEVNYSRPAMKGRAIFGELVPYGKVWRTGANGPTNLTFGEDVTVGGKAVKAGKYNLITIPSKSEWEVILTNPDVNATNFKDGNEVARFKTPVLKVPFDVENFTILFSDVTANSASIELAWANAYVAIPVKADIDTKIMGQIQQVMNVDSKPYFAAATYYFENGKDNAKALEWATKAVAAQPDAYWVAHLLAKVQAKAGKNADAKATANKSKDLAQKAGNMDYVKLNDDLMKSL